MKQVEDFIYLDSNVSSDGKCKKEIIKQIWQVEVIFNKKRSIFTYKNIEHQKEFAKNVYLEHHDTWIRAMDYSNRRNEKNRGIRNVVLQEDGKNIID